MIFLRPEILYLLIPFLVLFVFLLTQKENQAHFFSDEVMKKLRVDGGSLSMRTRNVFLALVGILVIIALAEPVIEDGKVEVKSKSADIMLALDISDSMLAEDIYPNRLKFAKKKAIDLLQAAPDERIGVIAFAKNSYLVSPMSFDHAAVSFLLQQLSTESITEKGTDFLSLLEVTNKTIKTDAKKYLLILTDGGDAGDFAKEIAYSKENNIVVFILGIGTEKGAPIKKEDGTFITYKGEVIVSKLNSKIADFASKSGGVYIESVKSDADIKRMLQEIENISDQKELKSETVEKFIPLFYYPLALALLILLIATSSLYKKQVMSSLAMVFLLFGSGNSPLEAGLLDFMELEKAKEAYEVGDFNTSNQIYSEYATKNDNAQSYYNSANALYKQERYDEAIKEYEKAYFDDNVSEANRYGNIGNSYVKQSTMESLQKALEMYEKSLELNEDKKIHENLEAVKKALEEEKKKQEQQKQENKDKQDNQNQEEKKNQEQSKDKQNDKKDQENSEEKKDSQEGEQSDENQEKNEESKENEKEDSQNKEPKQNNQEESKDKEAQEKKDLEKLDEQKELEEQEGAAAAVSEEQMSDAEEEKWIQKLNAQQNSYMYMLNNNKVDEEQSDEKPW